MIHVVVKEDLKKLIWSNRGWYLEDVYIRFSSLRVAKAWIKKNIGSIQQGIKIRLPGVLRQIEIKGTIEF